MLAGISYAVLGPGQKRLNLREDMRDISQTQFREGDLAHLHRIQQLMGKAVAQKNLRMASGLDSLSMGILLRADRLRGVADEFLAAGDQEMAVQMLERFFSDLEVYRSIGGDGKLAGALQRYFSIKLALGHTALAAKLRADGKLEEAKQHEDIAAKIQQSIVQD